jgi:hypothetical protein
MEIELGINPNCSETVFRISSKYKDMVPEEALSWGSLEPTEGYSQMRPTDGTFCVYYYQTGGAQLQRWLEENEIEYDIQRPFGDNDEDLVPIEPNDYEKEQAVDGGSGEFMRRIPYRGNRNRN